MVTSVSYLHIRPIYQYHGTGKGQTTVSGFDQLLKQETEVASENISGGQISSTDASDTLPQTGVTQQANLSSTAAPTGQTTETEETENLSDTAQTSSVNSDTTATSKTSLFKDPKTGTAVRYVDVSQDPDRVLETENVTKATTASSMKKTKYDTYFKEAAEKYHLSESLLKGIAKAESNFNPKDVSSAGASGIMQLMPATAKELGITDVFDPRQNILGGARCIKQKLKEFNGNVKLALAAYNAGSGAVRRSGGVPSYCTKYVNRVLSYKEAFETANAVG